MVSNLHQIQNENKKKNAMVSFYSPTKKVIKNFLLLLSIHQVLHTEFHASNSKNALPGYELKACSCSAKQISAAT